MLLDVEVEFRRLLAVAQVLPSRYESEVMGDDRDGGVDRYDFPTSTALTRASWAAAQFQPAVAVLGDNRTVHGCMLLLRGLLELWADFIYLTESTEQSERRRRAVAIEIRAAKQLLHSLRTPGVSDPVDADRSLVTVTNRLSRLNRIKDSEGWGMTGRAYGDVTGWLDKTGLDWPTPMYRGFSNAAHHHVTEWAADESMSPSWQFKAVRLEQCVVVYTNVALLALSVVRPDGDGSFETAVRSLRDDEVFRLALQGALG